MGLHLSAFIISLLSLSLSYANTSIDYGCTAPIKVALYDIGLLYSDSTKSGIDKDFLELLSKESNCQFETSLMPRARIWSELESGSLAISTSGISTPERNAFAYFINYIQSKNYALLRVSDKNLKLTNLNDFFQPESRNFIGVVRSFKHGTEIDSFLKKAYTKNRVKEFASIQNVYKAFLNNEINLMFSLQIVFPQLLKDYELERKIVIKNVSSENIPHGLILSRKKFNETQYQNWNILINKLLKNGSVKKNIAHHVPPQYLKDTLYKSSK